MIHLHRSKNKQFYFVVKAKNGEPLATSEMYTRKASAINGIKALRKQLFKYHLQAIDHTNKDFTIYIPEKKK